MAKGLFLTGTGTEIGKTYLAGLLVKKLHGAGKKAGYYKAAMSGNERDHAGHLIPGDALWVKEVSGIGQSLEEMCPYVYEHAYSPHLASRVEGNPVDLNVVKKGYEAVEETCEYITVEGSGGIICPIRRDAQVIGLEDIVKMLDLPCVIAADAGLGTINSVVLTVFYMKAHGMRVKGILLNNFAPGDPIMEDNRKMCEEMTGIPVIACIGHGDLDLDLDPEQLADLYE